MNLSKQNLANISGNVKLPNASIFSLPETVLQFGTGVLLRGLPDYFIDKANRQGQFNGRVVVVKSTSTGGTDAFATQDGLFTLLIKGIDDGKVIDETIVNSAISRVVSAKDEWASIIALASSANIKVIISNTTEVGIALVAEDKITAAPPTSFPGKLLAFLHERYQAFNGSAESGLVIIPTELIVNNGTKLKSIVVELAQLNGLDAVFINWLTTANDFCNSLVDRIVPGKLPADEYATTEAALGYKDELMIMSECYSLWAIESSNPKTTDVLSGLTSVDGGIVVVPSIDKFRELKLRILNGSHTFTCGLAVLAGFSTVKEAMADVVFEKFITNLALNAISPAIVNNEITLEEARAFSAKVLDRYRNPYLAHQWIAITMQYTSKMNMRNVPTIIKQIAENGFVPATIALGVAGYIAFMRSTINEKGQYIGTSNGKEYVITDDFAANLNEKWNNNSTETIAAAVLSDTAIWGTDLTQLTGFSDAVSAALQGLLANGFAASANKIA